MPTQNSSFLQIQPSSIPQDSFEAAAFKVDEWVDPFARILLDIRRAMYDDTHYSDTIIAIHCQVLLDLGFSG